MVARLSKVVFAVGAAVLCSETVTAVERHTVTLDDVFAVQSVGAVESSPDSKLVAIEAEKGILVLSVKDGGRVRKLSGNAPSWSPDGNSLAYFAMAPDGRQLYIWDRRFDTVRQASGISGGIFGNGWFGPSLCPEYSISWAPDSRNAVFATRLTGVISGSVPSREHGGIRVYDSTSAVDQTLIEGVFKVENFWDAFGSSGDADPDYYRKMKAIDLNPELGRSQLIVVSLDRNTWSVLAGSANQYACPSWSPDGKHIAAVAQLGNEYPNTYYGQPHVQRSTLSIFDAASGVESRPVIPVARAGKAVWSPHGNRIAMVVEAHAPIGSFPRILEYSLVSRESSFESTPEDMAALEVRWSRDGKTLLAKLLGRFAHSLWQLKPSVRHSRQVNAPVGQVDSFAEIGRSRFVLNTEAATFKGRVILTDEAGRAVRTLYDANPQTARLKLGEQRKLTWKNHRNEDVDGIVILPPDYVPGRRYPMIVNPYPRAILDDFKLASYYEDTGQLQAAHGYVIFRPALQAPHSIYYQHGEAYTDQARGAAGIPMMIDDFESGVAFVIKQGIVDPDRIGIFGHSNGGWATNIIITETSLIRAAMIESGISNAILMSFVPLPMVTRGIDPATNGNVFDNFEDYVKFSPIFRMRNIKIPVLLVVGDQDWPWLQQMIAEYAVLRSEGKNVGLVRYANESHTLRQRRDMEDGLERQIGFFDKYLKPQSPSPAGR